MFGADITVVIPAHNAEAFITEALDSINNQTVLPHKVIVVENASKDETYSCVDRYALESVVPIELIHTDCAGVSNARNIGFNFADTRLIALLDADDVYMDDFIEKAIDTFVRDPELVLFFGNRQAFSGNEWHEHGLLENTRVIRLPGCKLGCARKITGGLFEALLYGNFVSCSGAVVSREASFKAGLFPTNLRNSEDRFFFCMLALQGDAAYTLSTTHGYRVNSESASRSANADLLFLQSDMVLLMLWAELYQIDQRKIRKVTFARQKMAYDYLYTSAEKGTSDFIKGVRLVKLLNLNLRWAKIVFLFAKSVKNTIELNLSKSNFLS